MKKYSTSFLVVFFSGLLFATTDPIQPLLDSLQEKTGDNILETNESSEKSTLEQVKNDIENDSNLTSIELHNENEFTNTDDNLQGSEYLTSIEIPINEAEIINVDNVGVVQETKKIEHVRIDIPYTEHAYIDSFRKEYMTSFGQKRLAEIMGRATPYRLHIRQKLSEYEVPLALEYLPVIESSFITDAVSRSGATGLWQFMENSIAGLLEKDEWLDERHDPWLSTEAAAKKLKYNYSVLKDWELALAAYNMGLGGLQKAINRAGSDDFWYLAENNYIPSQTKNYVPKFIAVADLITNAEFYGLDIPAYDDSDVMKFTEITVNKQINLVTLADITDIDYATYEFLNPSFEFAITPPKDYMLRIPSESEEIILEAIEKQDSTSFLESHKVEQGDTLWSLSRMYNTTVDVLCEINNRNPNALLSIGTILFLPILK